MVAMIHWAIRSWRGHDAARSREAARGGWTLPVLVLLGLFALAPGARAASPYIWDEDTNGLDDRLETVNLLGFQYSFVNADTTGRQRVLVTRVPLGLLYGVYVVYDHTPTNSDLTALTLLGMPVLHELEALPVVRSVGTWAQVLLARSLPGVERIEAVPVIYPLLYENAASVAVRDASERVFPTWEGTGGADGTGVVIAFLDSGINDDPEGAWPGHESLTGRCSGGATFLSGDVAGDTPMNGTVNPADHGGVATSSHATHVAGIALGSGGPVGFARGIAPGAHFVDVKVLNDAGVGSGLPEALDWCIHNRTRNWGTPGYSGIQVINLSLSTPDSSDGNDVASRLAAKAVELGIVVVASMGNDGLARHVPSPAAGDGVIAVGAYDSQRTPGSADDQFASFSNRGPRASDGDGDALDELKPDLLAPGVSILSADGDETTDGHQYKRLSGTSMSAGFVSGAAARLLSAYPGITPAAVASLLRATAWRGTAGLPSGPTGADARWQASRGYGQLDLYAAKLEAEQPQRSQVTRLELTQNGSGIDAAVSTQRERGAAFFAIERAPDVGGVAGTFAGYDSAAAGGDSSLADPANRTVYPRSWSVPPGERGQAFWYRVAWTEGGTRSNSPARRFVSPMGASIATVEFTVVHNAYDTDLTGELKAGEAGNSSGTPFGILPGTSAAVATDWVDGVSTLGNVAWTFRVEVTDPAAIALLPPSNLTPWKLHLHEGGFLNRSGRITDYRLTWHREDGDLLFTGGPIPQPTIEGQEVVVAMPQGTAGVEGDTRAGAVRYGPNPIRSGGVVSFAIPSGAGTELRIFDLTGREVARTPVVVADGVARAQWRALDAHGGAIPPGIYLARTGAAPVMRIAVLR